MNSSLMNYSASLGQYFLHYARIIMAAIIKELRGLAKDINNALNVVLYYFHPALSLGVSRLDLSAL